VRPPAQQISIGERLITLPSKNAEETGVRLIIISGRSGSGKSTALNVLEDAGYYCIDNLPAGLLAQLINKAYAGADAPLARIAVSIDARNLPSDISRFEDIITGLPTDVKAEVVFLDATDAVLTKRFSETRRRHPLSNKDVSLSEALNAELLLLGPIASCASLKIDTSELTLHQLREQISSTVARKHRGGMVLLFKSFGFKYGIPIDADLVFDLRSLSNPHWVANLRPQSGLDLEVIEFLQNEDDVMNMLADIRHYLDKWVPHYARSNRSYLTVAIGCTGGRHRSVYFCEQLYKHFIDRFPDSQLRHRDL